MAINPPQAKPVKAKPVKASVTPTPPAEEPKADISPNLVVQHNLSEKGLHFAHQLDGSLVAPSIAVSHKSNPLTGFGDITLLGHPELINPTHTPVFDADVYSPRQPKARHRINAKKVQGLTDWLGGYAKKMGNTGLHAETEEEAERHGPDFITAHRNLREPAQLAFLEEVKGKKLEPPTRDAAEGGGYPFLAEPAMQEFAQKHGTKGQYYYPGEEGNEEYDKGLHEAARASIHSWAKNAAANIKGTSEKELRGLYRAYDMPHNKLLALEDRVGYGRLKKLHAALDRHKETGGREIDRGAFSDMVEKEIAPYQTEFEGWARQKAAPVVGQLYMPKGSRKLPYTASNVLKEMTRNLQGGENFNYGLGTARSHGAFKMRNLQNIKDRASQIVPHEEFEAKKKVLDERFGELANELTPHYAHEGGFRKLEDLSEAIGNSYKRGHSLSQELSNAGFKGLSPEKGAKVAQFANDLREMPTEYFEAKPQRLVGLHEFKAAVVPHDAQPETLDILRHHGINHIETYDRNKENSRAEAIRRAAEAQKLMLGELDFAKMEEPLEKGYASRALPFNPQETRPPKEKALSDWQDNGFRSTRSSLGVMPLKSNERKRAILKLSGDTPTRRGANGKLEFLLHRGMGPKEINATERGGTIANKSLSSWTPRYNIARFHAGRYTGITNSFMPDSAIPKSLRSAWISEDSIHSIPKQYGKITPRGPEGGGANLHEDEYEVIVRPHSSKLAAPEDMGLVEDRFRNDYPELPSTLNSRINQRTEVKKSEPEPISESEKLMQHPDPAERSMALKLNSLNHRALQTACLDADPLIYQQAIQHPQTTAETLLSLFGSSQDMDGHYPWIQQHFAFTNHPDVSAHHVDLALDTAKGTDHESVVKIFACGCDKTSSEALETLWESANDEDKVKILSNPNTPSYVADSVVVRLIKDVEVNSVVAKAAIEVASPLVVEDFVKKSYLGNDFLPERMELVKYALQQPTVSSKAIDEIVKKAAVYSDRGHKEIEEAALQNPNLTHEQFAYLSKLVVGRRPEGLIKSIDEAHFKAISKALTPEGPKMVDHRPDLEAHPAEHQPLVDAYRSQVLGNTPVKPLKKGDIGGITKKVLYATQTPAGPGKVLVKPYHEKIVKGVSSFQKFPIQGWAEMTSQALAHAGGIGHLHQKVHVSEHGLNGQKEPMLVVHMEGARPYDFGEMIDNPMHQESARKIGVMDFLQNNLDRHFGNILNNNGAPLAIDHSRNFQYLSPGGSENKFVPLKRKNKLDSFGDYISRSAIGKLTQPLSATLAGSKDQWLHEKWRPVLDWWQDSSPKIRETFDNRLNQIKDPKVKEHLKRNFNERANWLDEAASGDSENGADYDRDWYKRRVPIYHPEDKSESELNKFEALGLKKMGTTAVSS